MMSVHAQNRQDSTTTCHFGTSSFWYFNDALALRQACTASDVDFEFFQSLRLMSMTHVT